LGVLFAASGLILAGVGIGGSGSFQFPFGECGTIETIGHVFFLRPTFQFSPQVIDYQLLKIII
jgi:hypothetical protein